MLPDYAGGSILNVVASVGRHFGVEVAHPGFRGELPLEGAEVVVLVIADALGHHQLQRHVAEGDAPHLSSLLRSADATYTTATSVFPSTTMAAVTSLHTCAAPSEHGYLGYTVWLEEVASVVNLITQREILTETPLPDASFLATVPSLASRLSAEGVSCVATNPATYEGSFLSSWYLAGVERVLGYRSPATAASLIGQALPARGRAYATVYWPDYDAVCHQHGPSSRQAADEAASLDLAVGRLVAGLPRGRSALVLLADHGQLDLPPERVDWPEDEPGFAAAMPSHPGGEARMRYFRVREGSEALVRERLERSAEVVPAAEAWAGGLFGGPPAREAYRSRVGDLIAVGRDGGGLGWSYGGTVRHTTAGVHGGWSEAEMRVPVLTVRV